MGDKAEAKTEKTEGHVQYKIIKAINSTKQY